MIKLTSPNMCFDFHENRLTLEILGAKAQFSKCRWVLGKYENKNSRTNQDQGMTQLKMIY